MLDHAPDGVLLVDGSERLTYANDSAARLLGLGGEAVGSGLEALRSVLGEDLVEACRATSYDGAEREVVRPRPEQGPVTTRIAPGADGVVLQVHATSPGEHDPDRDGARFRELFESMAEGVAETAAGGAILMVNPAFARMLGYDDPDDLLTHVANARDLYLDPRERATTLGRVETDGRDVAVRQLLRRDGSTVWVRAHSAARRGPDDEIVAVHAIVEDITESHGAEQRVLRAQEQVRMAFQVNPVPLAIVRGRGEDDLEVGRCNDALCHLIGADPARVHDRSLTEVLGPSYAPPLVPPLRRVYDGEEEPREFEIELPRPGAAPLTVVLNTSVFDDLDGTRYLLVVVYDVTRRRSAEVAMADLAGQRERLLVELMQVEQGEGDRIAAELHDEPVQWLAAAQLRLHLLSTRLQDDLPDALPMVAVLDELLRQVSRRLRLLLVELEPFGSEEGVEAPRGFDEALGATVDYLFDGTDTEVEVHGAVPHPRDPRAAVTLHRVLREALSNARRHAHAGHVVVRIEQTGSEHRIEVEDDGVGVQGPISPRPGHRGIRDMRTRVEALGGSMRIEPRSPHGTRVLVRVPLAGTGALSAGEDPPR